MVPSVEKIIDFCWRVEEFSKIARPLLLELRRPSLALLL